MLLNDGRARRLGSEQFSHIVIVNVPWISARLC